MIRVMVVAQGQALRAGLRTLLEAGEALQVTAEAASLGELGPAPPQADVLVVAAEGLDDEHLQLEWEPESSIPVLWLFAGRLESDSLPARGRLELGPPPLGVLSLEAGAEELQAAVAALHQGLTVGEAGLLGRLLNPPQAAAAPQQEPLLEPLAEPLTARELEVLQLLAHGLANKQIALALGVSEHTIKFHVSSIYSRLGATNRMEAVRLGVRQGLIVL